MRSGETFCFPACTRRLFDFAPLNRVDAALNMILSGTCRQLPRVFTMGDPETAAIVELQERVRTRLLELGFAADHSAANLAHHLAEISVLSRNFSEHTLPLFLSLSSEHRESLARLIISVKCDLDQLRDALTDVEPDLLELMSFLNP